MKTCKSIKCFGKTIRFRLWDTSGAERYWHIQSHHYNKANGVLLVFDLTRRDTFLNINSWFEKLKSNTNESVESIILVGNKSDLKDQRVVSYEEAKLLADELGIFYLETSVKTGINMRELDQFLIKIQMSYIRSIRRKIS